MCIVAYFHLLFFSLSLFLIGGVVVVVAAVVDGTIVDVAEWTAAMAWRI